MPKPTPPGERSDMDKTDFQILQILQKKARIPNVEVARTIGMAPSAILERSKKLEALGVIQGYEVRLNPEMFHCAMTAFVHLKVKDSSQIPETAKAVADIEQVQEVHYLAGEDCLMAKIKLGDNRELETILTTRISQIESIASTRTFIALATYKETAKIKLPDHP